MATDTIKKVISVEPVPRAVDISELRPRLLKVCKPELADEILKYDGFRVTLECGHVEDFVNRPKRTEYDCYQCRNL